MMKRSLSRYSPPLTDCIMMESTLRRSCKRAFLKTGHGKYICFHINYGDFPLGIQVLV